MRVSGDEEIQHEDEHYERYYLKWLSSLKKEKNEKEFFSFRTKAKKKYKIKRLTARCLFLFCSMYKMWNVLEDILLFLI